MSELKIKSGQIEVNRKRKSWLPAWHPGDPKNEDEFRKAYENGTLPASPRRNTQRPQRLRPPTPTEAAALIIAGIEKGRDMKLLANDYGLELSDVENVYQTYSKCFDMPISEFRQKRADILTGLEALAVQSIMERISDPDASLRDITSALKVIAESRRLEEGKATAIAAVTKQMTGTITDYIDVTPIEPMPDK